MRYYRLWIYTCNVVLLAGAVGLAVAAGRVLTDARRSLLPGLANLSLTDPRLLAAALALAAQGGLLQALGCAGALRLSERLLHAYWFLLLALLLADAALGLAWLVRVHRLAADLRPALRARLATEYGASPAFTEAWDALQRERHCCGVEGPHDFLLLSLPPHPYLQSTSQGQSTTDGTSANPHAFHNPFIQQPAVNFNGITSPLDSPTKGDVDRGRRPDPPQYLTLPESCCRWVVPKARDRGHQQAAGAAGPLPPPPPPPQQNKQTTSTEGQGAGSSVVRLPIVPPPQPIPIPPQSQNSSPILPPCRNGNETIQRWRDTGDEEDATDNSLEPLAGVKGGQAIPSGPTNPANVHPNQVSATPAAGAALTSRNQRTQQSSKGHVIPPPPPEMTPSEGVAVGVGPCHRIGALAGFEGQAPRGSAWVPLSVFLPPSPMTAHSPPPTSQSPHYGVLTGEAFATGCEARLLTWLRQSADGLFVLGFCVIAFLKLCFVGILRYEIREMVQKIRLLRGCGDEEGGVGGILSPGERISVNGDDDDEDVVDGDSGVGANLIGGGVGGGGGGGGVVGGVDGGLGLGLQDPASTCSNSVTTTFMEGLAPPPPSNQPLGSQQQPQQGQPPPPAITHNHLVHNHLLLGGPSLLQPPPQSPQSTIPLLQHHNHVPLPRHLLLHHHHHLHHLLLAGGGGSLGANGGDSTALPMDAGLDSLESTPVHRRSSTVRTSLKDALQNNNDGTDSDTNSNCALIVDRGSELSNASPPFNLRSSYSGPNGNNNELHELQELRKKSVSRQTQI
ncbi:uncharacterized protein LOC124161362 [Ischnura elegans]|uniref:uncharacterized protein LOC124161362 n=1 Tax=Ischnura elegans TaxID=197161 RepID=UPI001ED8A764|nr:uncharacterized protein LOC124161362 [Ischnura elegans]